MVSHPNEQQTKLNECLKRLAPNSVIDAGTIAASEGAVSECSRSGRVISGLVRAKEENEFGVQLTIIAPNQIEASCQCSSPEEMAEQWCLHAVALLLRAGELGFFTPRAGFAPSEATFRMNLTSPSDIAAVLMELRDPPIIPAVRFAPKVDIALDAQDDRLSVRVFFDGEVQVPMLFEGIQTPSDRALDNILLGSLDELGSWDERQSLWYVNSSQGIERILGIIEEYDSVFLLRDRSPITFSHELLNAKLSVDWQSHGVELKMSWVLPDQTELARVGSIVGTGPYWSLVDHTFYRLSAPAARIASMFPTSAPLKLTRAQLAPLLESLGDEAFSSPAVEILNPHLKPETEIRPPKVILTRSGR